LDELKAHRWFAVEFNNRAWDLVEDANRSPDEDELMIHPAHAASLHWLKVGAVIHHLRGKCLLATAYAAARLGEAATRHDEKCLQLCKNAGDEPTAFDRASAYGSAANAYACAGNLVRAEENYRLAVAAAADCSDAADRQVIERLYRPPVSLKK
jgi:hypothetical protein